MFTIDFLQKKARPKKSDPVGAGIYAAVVVVFVLGICIYSMQYFSNNSMLISKQKALSNLEARLEGGSEKTALKLQLEKNLAVFDQCNIEIANSIDRYVQWTPILSEISKTLPNSILLNELKVSRTAKKKRVKNPNDPSKQMDYEIVKRVLDSDVHDFMPTGDSSAVNDYLTGWRKSQALKNAFDDIYLAESSDAQFRDSQGNVHNVKNHIIKGPLRSQQITD